MVITLRDHTKVVNGNVPSSIETDWERALRIVGLQITDSPQVFDASYDSDNETLETKGTNAVVFLHPQDNLNIWCEAFINQTFSGHLVIISRTGRPPSPVSWCDRIHICEFTPVEFETSERAKQFVISVNDGHPDWALLRKSSCCGLVALRLLCDAWLTNFTYSLDRTKRIVTAPQNRSQWFSHFAGVDNNSKTWDNEQDVITEADRIASQMGTVRDDVKKFLLGLYRSYSITNETEQIKSLEPSIRSMVQILDSASGNDRKIVG